MNPVVYDWFMARLEPGFEGAPFYRTQSEWLNEKNLPPIWFTWEMSNPTNDRLCIGEPALYRESGLVSVVFLEKSGRGVRASLVIAQHFADYMRNTYKTMRLAEDNGIEGTLRLPIIGAPEPDPFENGNWSLCSVGFTYTYDSVRGTA